MAAVLDEMLLERGDEGAHLRIAEIHPMVTASPTPRFYVDEELYRLLSGTTPLDIVIRSAAAVIPYAIEQRSGTALAYVSQPSARTLHLNGQDLLDGIPQSLNNHCLIHFFKESLTKQEKCLIPGGRKTYDNLDGAMLIEEREAGPLIVGTGYHFTVSYQPFLDAVLMLPNGRSNWERAGFMGEVNTRHLSALANSYELSSQDPYAFIGVIGAGGDFTIFYDGRELLTQFPAELTRMAENRRRATVQTVMPPALRLQPSGSTHQYTTA